MPNEQAWVVEHTPDEFDSAADRLVITDGDTEHPQGVGVLATINVAMFAPHVEHALEIAHLMAAAPRMRDTLRWIANTAPQAYNSQGSEVVINEMRQAALKALADISGTCNRT